MKPVLAHLLRDLQRNTLAGVITIGPLFVTWLVFSWVLGSLAKAGEQKLKMGGSVTYSWKKWLAFQGRYDLVQPNLHDNTQSFQVISPSVIFSSRFASNEQIILQYSHYVNGKNVHGGYPYEALPPDENSLRIAAVMWW